MLLAPGRKSGGADERARPVAAIYDPELTLELPLDATVGTTMNALAHCAEAYYHPARTQRAERHADTGATAIGYALPLVVSELDGIYGRTRLLEGAMRAALALVGLGALPRTRDGAGRSADASGSRRERPTPSASRRRSASTPSSVPDAVARLASALGVDDAPGRLAELARLGGFERLRDLGVPEGELDEVAEAVVGRPGARANPRPATAAEVADLLRSVW